MKASQTNCTTISHVRAYPSLLNVKKEYTTHIIVRTELALFYAATRYNNTNQIARSMYQIPTVQGGPSPGEPGLGWLLFWMFHPPPGSAWAGGKLAELAGQLGNMVEHPNQSQPNPGPQADAGLGSIGDTVTEDTEDTGLLSNFILT